MVRKQNDMKALRDMISEAHDILRTIDLPEERSRRAYELLSAALHLADHILETPPAATLGAKGGSQTAKRGSEYFRKIASMRKEKKGGRPKPN
jgi:septal ring factor EnvC (AmiA/AmiB activator)